ncbi:MAG TPA: hypothetical protein VEL51_06415 [Vicinamibacterales bacterium]|nr:hypothetical protein [Vicinamibacterales bacterium]
MSRLSRFARVAIHPEPELGLKDTGLHYTDILFGFVIHELFIRIQNWPSLDSAVKWHLVAGTVLVLGSWIGYHRSRNRPAYEVKFFNLPLFGFVVDQLMLILYFRIAILTPITGPASPDWAFVVRSTLRLVTFVFVLYLTWDLLALWMATARRTDEKGRTVPRYPAVRDEVITDRPALRDAAGILITVLALLLLAALWISANRSEPRWVLPGVILILLAYRWAKEIRTSYRLSSAQGRRPG